MSESSESPTNSQGNRFAEILRGIKGKFRQKHADTPLVQKEESEPPKLVYPLSAESSENLRPAHRLLFHTTPVSRFESIKHNGLITNPEDPSISQSLGYSIYFGHEHGVMRSQYSNQSGIRNTTPDNYVLTIWEAGKHTQQSKVDMAIRNRFLTPSQLVEQTEVPDMFFDASPGGALFLLTGERLGKLPPQHLIGGFLLDKKMRDEFQKALIYARYGMKTADEIEQDLSTTLSKDSKVQLRTGIEVKDLTHNLVVSIEHDLLRFIVSPLLKEAQIRSNIWQRDGHYSGTPISALWHIIFYRSQINDPVSARYLDKSYDFIIKTLAGKGVEIESLQQRLLRSVKDYKEGNADKIAKEMLKGDEGNYFGFTNGSYAAMELMQEMGIEKP